MQKRYESAPTVDTIVELVVELIEETGTISKTRKNQSVSGLKAILREQNEKWQAFCRRCPSVPHDSYRIGLHN